MFDDVKGKIVEATEAPDDNAKENDGLGVWMLKEENGGGEKSDDKEKDSLDFDPARVG
jgi:hypothetical protein